MGRGRSRSRSHKARNFATFRLCPRPGALNPSDRVFVRVDDNPYHVPGFDHAAGDGDRDGCGEFPSSPAEGELPEHVRLEILELGLPDDGYNYLSHLREFRNTAYVPNRRRLRFGLPSDVKVYDASRVPVGSGEAAEAAPAPAVRPAETAIDPDVAKLLEESDDAMSDGSEDEGLDDDFVIVASQSEEGDQIEEDEEIICVIEDDDQFVLVALEKNVEGLYSCEPRTT